MRRYIPYLFILILAYSCGNNPLKRDWSIPVDDIETGLSENDIMPSIDNGVFIPTDDITYVNEDELVFVVKSGDEIKVYPEKILEWHQAVNDQINGNSIAVGHSTLSGLSSCWNRFISNRTLSFGVSRFLYKNNQIFYDRETLNYWSQILAKSVSGNLIDLEFERLKSIVMTWRSAQSNFPDAMVLSDETGFVRNYDEYPYSNYRTDHDDFIFEPTNNIDTLIYDPILNVDTTIMSKERVLGIQIDSIQKVYRFSSFGNPGISIKTDTVLNIPLLVIASRNDQFAKAFYHPPGIEFIPSAGAQSLLTFEDTDGNKYNPLGEVIEGPSLNFQLDSPKHDVAYWFIWKDYFPEVLVY